MDSREQQKTFNVEIDIELRPIVPEFLHNRQNDCSLINRCLEEGSYSEIRTLGHRMKGTGGSYGFDDISEIGEILENAALANDRETIRLAMQRLSDYLDRVEVVYV